MKPVIIQADFYYNGDVIESFNVTMPPRVGDWIELKNRKTYKIYQIIWDYSETVPVLIVSLAIK